MEPGREADPPPTADETPMRVAGPGAAPASESGEPVPTANSAPPAPSLLTAESLLRAIAAAAGPWFPSQHASEAGVPRDSLDEPLAELRLAGLVKVADWVRGLGQGYVLTPEGQAAAADATALDRLRRAQLVVTAPAPAAAEEPAAPDTPADEPAAERELVIRPPVVVPALLVANALWFFVCAVAAIRWGISPSRALGEGHPEVLHRFGAVTGADLLDGEWWRLVSSCFVHIGALHLVGNLLALAMMGPLAELLWGRMRLVLIYFVSGLAGSALAMTLRPEALLAGASGAIWGIQMSLFAWLLAFRQHLPSELASDWLRRLCVVFIINAGVSFLPGVSWEGHLGGGVAGFLAAGLLNVARFGDAGRRFSAWLLLALLPVLSVAGLGAAMDAKGMPGWQRIKQRVAAREEARAEAERKQKLQDAQAAFRSQVIPRLERIAPISPAPMRGGVLPFNATPAELDAILVLKGAKRTPERTAASRENIRALKVAAAEAVSLTSGEPTGVESFDRQRERVRAFAAARSKSFDLLLALFEPGKASDPSAWAAWQASRDEAHRLWSEMAPR